MVLPTQPDSDIDKKQDEPLLDNEKNGTVVKKKTKNNSDCNEKEDIKNDISEIFKDNIDY